MCLSFYISHVKAGAFPARYLGSTVLKTSELSRLYWCVQMCQCGVHGRVS